MAAARKQPPIVRLERHGDSVHAFLGRRRKGVPVTLVYARPLSARGRQVSLIDIKSKEEVAWLESLDELDDASRTVAEETLRDRYRISVIRSVTHSFVNHGHRYLKVETDRGPCYFNLREPGKNVTRVTDDHLVIRDSMGNRYDVPSLAALDPESRQRLDLVL